MKTTLLLAAMLLATNALAKISRSGDQLFIEAKGKSSPLGMVNDLISKKQVSKVKLYGDGDMHLISFAKEGEKERLYSVDEKGYTYAIKPFADYSVDKIKKDRVEFKEQPGREYKVSSTGLFLQK